MSLARDGKAFRITSSALVVMDELSSVLGDPQRGIPAEGALEILLALRRC